MSRLEINITLTLNQYNSYLNSFRFLSTFVGLSSSGLKCACILFSELLNDQIEYVYRLSLQFME